MKKRGLQCAPGVLRWSPVAWRGWLFVAAAARMLATLAADLGHVLPIGAYGFAAFLAGAPRFFAGELMRGPFLVGGMTSLAGNPALLFLIHRSEPAVTLFLISHWTVLLRGTSGR